jgi:hypothetical protein
MKYQKPLVALALIACAAATNNAQASLVDRGGGLLYDNVLNITWLQDANYAKTSGIAGISATGEMNWNTATDWATNLVYGGYSDWRLASNAPVNGDNSFRHYYAVDGSTDDGYNITSPYSELAYMYNVNLGLKGIYDTNGIYQPAFGIFGNGAIGGQNNVGLVINLQSSTYWSGTGDAFSLNNGFDNAWLFHTDVGNQHYSSKGIQHYAWAVRPGDVAAVPLPGAVLFFLSGLFCLSGLAQIRKNLAARIGAAW